MKTISLAIAILFVFSSVASAQYGLGTVQQSQPVVVQQAPTYSMFGLGVLPRRSFVARPMRSVYGLQVSSEYIAPMATETEQAKPAPMASVLTTSAPVYYQQTYVPPAPVVQTRQRWRWVQQKQCTARGCQMAWVRVWQ